MIKIKKNSLKQICFKSSLFVLVVVLCFCCFNLFVNADSLLTTDSYRKMSYFNWDSITISTERGGDSSTGYYPTNSIVYGSNDSNGQDIFTDVMSTSYDVETGGDVPTDLIGYTVSVPSDWSATAGYGVFTASGVYNSFSFSKLYIGYSSPSNSFDNYIVFYFVPDRESVVINLNDVDSFSVSFTGGDATNTDLIQWFVDNGATFNLTNSVNVFANETIDYSIVRNVVKNETLSTTTHKCYDVELSSNVPIYQIIFEKNDFYIYSNDLNNGFIPHIMLNLLNQGFNIQYSYDVRFLNKNGSISGGYSTSDETELLNYQPLIRNFDSVFALELNENDNVLFYVNSLKVYVSSNQLNTSFTDFKYRYFVESEDYYNEYFKNAKFTFSNIEGIEGLGNSLLQSVNAFMSFELVPGFSLMNILTLLVVIPLLVWILKMFLGG